MRINAIGFNPNLSFKKRERLYTEKEASPYTRRDNKLFISTPEEFLPYRIEEELKKTGAIKKTPTPQTYRTEAGTQRILNTSPFYGPNAANRLTRKELDMDAILSTQISPKAEKQPLPFIFSDHKNFTLDKYQKEAIEHFNNGNSVICTAPTGTGKTLIAEYAIDNILNKGGKVIYLSPLKALSNEKFVKMAELFGDYDENLNFLGAKDVGLITGDVAINPNAHLLVMTTEIYRNTLLKNTPDKTEYDFKDFDAVIYDEFHYLADPDRGKVWEEAVINTPKHMKQMMLSATASNNKEIQEWINNVSDINVKTVNVPEEERHVPLKEYIWTTGQGGTKKELFELGEHRIKTSKLLSQASQRQKLAIKEAGIDSVEELLEGLPIKNGSFIDSKDLMQKLVDKGLNKEEAEATSLIMADKASNQYDIDSPYKFTRGVNLPALISTLDNEKKLPALFFIFSKKNCQKTMEQSSKTLGTLLSTEESKAVLDRIETAEKKGVYLGADFDQKYKPYLMSGYAVHHAGMLPAYKSLIEGLSRDGLIKCCFATETLLAGINMPFKTVVFTSCHKYSNGGEITISPSTFKQGAGRAGRRGIDKIGNVVIIPSSYSDYSEYLKLFNSTDTSIKSKYDFSYATLLNPNVLNDLDQTYSKTLYFNQNNHLDNKLMKKAKAKISYLKSKGYIEKNDNETFSLTNKGETARKIYGINQILMSEFLNDPKYYQNLSSSELAGLMTIFADVGDKSPRSSFGENNKEIEEKCKPTLELAKTIKEEQKRLNIQDEIKMNTKLVPAVIKFAQMEKDPQNDTKNWASLILELREDSLLKHEGDFLRVVNGTIDLLKTVQENSKDEELSYKAGLAVKQLQKPPVTDILAYELNGLASPES